MSYCRGIPGAVPHAEKAVGGEMKQHSVLLREEKLCVYETLLQSLDN